MENMDLLMIKRALWQEAKGKLNAILEYHVSDMRNYQVLKNMFDEFINKIDNESPIA
jgi:hypothetical protein